MTCATVRWFTINPFGPTAVGIYFSGFRPKNQIPSAIATPSRTFSTTFIIAFIIARRSPAAGDDLKRDLGGIPLLFVMRDDLKRDMAQIPLLFVSMLELCWAIAMPPHKTRTNIFAGGH